MSDHEQRAQERIASTLRASQPRPEAAFVRRLERRLLPRRWPPLHLPVPARPVLVGAMAAMLLAALGLVASLAGWGPLGGQDAVRAGDECRWETVRRVERVPRLVEPARGEPRIVYRRELVTRRVERCR